MLGLGALIPSSKAPASRWVSSSSKVVTKYLFSEQSANIWDIWVFETFEIFEVVSRYLFREQSATELGSLAASPTLTPRHFSRKKPMKIPKLKAGIPTTILETSQEQRSHSEGLPSLQNGSCHLADVVVTVDVTHRWQRLVIREQPIFRGLEFSFYTNSHFLPCLAQNV